MNAASGQPSHAHQGCHPERSEGPVQLATAPAGLYAVPNPDGNAIADPRTAATHFPSPLVIPNPHAKRAGEGPYETCAAAWTRPGVPMLRAVPEDAIQFAPEPRPRSRTRFVRSLPCPPSSGRIGMTITLGLEAMRNPRQYAAPRLVIPNPHAKRAGEGPYETCAAAWTQPGVAMLRAAPEDAIRLPSATSQKLGPSPALLVGQARDDIQNEPKSGNPQASK